MLLQHRTPTPCNTAYRSHQLINSVSWDFMRSNVLPAVNRPATIVPASGRRALQTDAKSASHVACSERALEIILAHASLGYVNHRRGESLPHSHSLLISFVLESCADFLQRFFLWFWICVMESNSALERTYSREQQRLASDGLEAVMSPVALVRSVTSRSQKSQRSIRSRRMHLILSHLLILTNPPPQPSKKALAPHTCAPSKKMQRTRPTREKKSTIPPMSRKSHLTPQSHRQRHRWQVMNRDPNAMSSASKTTTPKTQIIGPWLRNPTPSSSPS